MNMVNLKQMKKYIRLGLFLFIVLSFFSFFATHANYFFRPFDSEYFGDLYSRSQYVVGAASKGGIGDDGLYAFAGYYYLFQHGDPSSVNFEHPPLGKYLIGLSILLFKNENVINIIYAVLLSVITFYLSKRILKKTTLSLICVAILTTDPLIRDHLIRSFLDIPFTLFFVIAVYFFLKSLSKPLFFALSQLFWGITFSVKFFPSFIFVYGYMILVILIRNKKLLRPFFMTSVIIPVVYLFSHTAYFVYHPSLIEFIQHKKWVFSWWSSSPILIGNIWKNILTGRYIDSVGAQRINDLWTPLLPITVIFALLNAPFRNLETQNEKVILYGLCIVYLLYVSFFTGGVEKFIMPVYPFLIILSVDSLNRLLCSIIAIWKKRVLTRSREK